MGGKKSRRIRRRKKVERRQNNDSVWLAVDKELTPGSKVMKDAWASRATLVVIRQLLYNYMLMNLIVILWIT